MDARLRQYAFVIALIFCASVLSACGGGGGGGSDGPGVARYTVGGTVSGLSGDLIIEVNSVSHTLSGSGRYTLAAEYDDGTVLNVLLLETPLGFSCSLSLPNGGLTIAGQNMTDLNIQCSGAALSGGEIRGQLDHYRTGEPIANAEVTAYALVAGTYQPVAVSTSDQKGQFVLDNTGISEHISVQIDAPGFCEQSVIVGNSVEVPEVDMAASLLPITQALDLDMTNAAIAVVNGIGVVELPAFSLVDAQGETVDAATAAICLLDPSSDPGILPGNFQALSAAEQIEPIESFGAIGVTFSDAEGERLTLADGSSALIRIPLASVYSQGTAPATVPLFFFDPLSGYWREEGQAVLTEIAGDSYFEGVATHFTTWNADRVYQSVTLQGCVEDAAGTRVANALVRGQGRDYIGLSESYTDAAGNFSLAVKMDAQVLLSASSGVQGNTQVIATGTGDETLPECLSLSEAATTITLTWGALPEDLDAHLYVPTDTEFEDHIFWSNPREVYANAVIELDVDDRESFGPEVNILTGFPFPGRYRYFVNRFEGSSDIAASGARVELNLQGERHVFSPPQDQQVTDHWAVFELIVDQAGAVTLDAVNEFRANQNP